MSRSRRIMRSKEEAGATVAMLLGLVGPVHFRRRGIAVRPFQPEVSVFDAHGFGRRYVPVIPEEAPFGVDDVNFLLLARNGITQRSKLQFDLAGNTQFGSHAVYAQLDRLTNWPFEFLDRSGQRLPGHAAQLARKN